MQNGLEMQTGPRFLKPAILAAVVVAFGVTAFVMTSGDEGAPAAPVAAATDQTEVAAAAESSTAPAMESAAGGTDSMAPATPAGPNMDVSATAGSAAAPMTNPATNTPASTAASSMPSESVAATSPAETMPVDKTASAEPTASPEPTSARAEDTQLAAAKPTKASGKAKLLKPAKPPAAEALRPWWTTPNADERFALEYVGQAADQKSLVIRFNREVTDPAAQQNIKLLTAKGETVAANWQAGADPRVLVAPNLQPGRYTVLVDSALASSQGQQLGTALHGPAFIQ